MIHEDYQQLLGAYAVDAVDDEEHAAVAAHLVECPRCRAEVAELREVAAFLSHSGTDAPPEVWDRIAATLDAPRPPLRLPTTGRRRMPPWPVRVAIVAAAASIVVFSVAITRLQSDVDRLRRGGSETAVAAARALGDPKARVARLTGTADRSALAVVQPDGQAYLVGDTLPPLDHRIYQLWGQTADGTVTSLGTVPGPGVFSFAADPSVKVVMVTIERAPVAKPSSAPVLTGTLA